MKNQLTSYAENYHVKASLRFPGQGGALTCVQFLHRNKQKKFSFQTLFGQKSFKLWGSNLRQWRFKFDQIIPGTGWATIRNYMVTVYNFLNTSILIHFLLYHDSSTFSCAKNTLVQPHTVIKHSSKPFLLYLKHITFLSLSYYYQLPPV